MLTSAVTIALLAVAGVLAARCSPLCDTHAENHAVGSGLPSLRRVATPYAMLTVFLLLTRLVAPFRNFLQTHAILSVAAFNLRLPMFYIPGFWVLLAAGLSMRVLGIQRRGMCTAVSAAWVQFAPSAIAILSFLATAQVMQGSGMTATLGMTAASLGRQYVWLSPWLAALSGWTTGSVVGGNSMFALLQKSVALRTGLSLSWMIAAQNAACSLGRMLSPACLVLAVTSARCPDEEGHLLRLLGPLALWAIVVVMALLSIVTNLSPGTLALPLLLGIMPLFVELLAKVRSSSLLHALARSSSGPRCE